MALEILGTQLESVVSALKPLFRSHSVSARTMDEELARYRHEAEVRSSGSRAREFREIRPKHKDGKSRGAGKTPAYVAIMQIIVSLVAMGAAIYFLKTGTSDQKIAGGTLIGAVVGYWLR